VSDGVLAHLRVDGSVALGEVSDPLLRADDLGVLRGEGVFETLRTEGGQPLGLARHLDRMRRSAARLHIALPAAEALAALARAAGRAGAERAGGSGQLRLVATPGPAGGGRADDERRGVTFALHVPAPPEYPALRERGIAAITLTLGVGATARRDAPWLLGGVKTTSYAVPMAALRVARAAGVEDVLWISADGELLEGPTSTALVVRDRRAASPPSDEVGILAGTTLAVLDELLRAAGADPVEIRRVGVAEVRAADELMLLSSVRGVVGVVSLDGAPVGGGAGRGVGPVTARARDIFEAAAAARRF
jgi:4-amino-4-deoxychorismate lyase